MLSFREHSNLELKRKLLRKGFDEATIHLALDNLSAEGLQSDARFAESYIRTRVLRGYGPLRIAGELAERGIAGELIEQALNQAEIEWQMQVTKVRCKRFGKNPPEDFTERARQMRFLQYRGFTHEQISSAFLAD